MEGERSLRAALSTYVSVLSELVAARLEPALEANGINFGTFELLSAAHAADGKACQAELARRLGITPPSLCEAVKTAAARGLVEQRRNPRDQRAFRIRLTRKGGTVLRRLLKALAEVERDLVEGVSDARLATTLGVLQQAVLNLQRPSP